MNRELLNEITRQRNLIKKLNNLNEATTPKNPWLYLYELCESGLRRGKVLGDVFTEDIVTKLKSRDINTIDDLKRALRGQDIDDNATALIKRGDIPAPKTKIDDIIEDMFDKSVSKIFNDSEMDEVAYDVIGEYFNFRINQQAKAAVDLILTLDPKIPAQKQKLDQFIAGISDENFLGKEHPITRYFERQYSNKMKEPTEPPKVDTDTPTPPKTGGEGDLGTTSKTILDDPSSNKISEEEKIDFDADGSIMNKVLNNENPDDEIRIALSDKIRESCEKFELFKKIPLEKQEEIIKEVQAKFVIAYNKSIKNINAQIKGQIDDPKVIEKLDKLWQDVNVLESMRQKAVGDAMKDLKVTYPWNTKERWMYSFATWKDGPTGRNLTKSEIAAKYWSTVKIGMIVSGVELVFSVAVKGTNMGYDNIPGDNLVEKGNYLFPWDKALFKVALPGVGHIITWTAGSPTSWFINSTRKPSQNEIRKKLSVPNDSIIKFKEPQTDNLDKERSVGVIINDQYIGDYTYIIKGTQSGELRKTAKGDVDYGNQSTSNGKFYTNDLPGFKEFFKTKYGRTADNAILDNGVYYENNAAKEAGVNNGFTFKEDANNKPKGTFN